MRLAHRLRNLEVRCPLRHQAVDLLDAVCARLRGDARENDALFDLSEEVIGKLQASEYFKDREELEFTTRIYSDLTCYTLEELRQDAAKRPTPEWVLTDAPAPVHPPLLFETPAWVQFGSRW